MLNINIKGLAFVTTLGCRAPYSRTFMIFWTQNRSNTMMHEAHRMVLQIATCILALMFDSASLLVGN